MSRIGPVYTRIMLRPFVLALAAALMVGCGSATTYAERMETVAPIRIGTVVSDIPDVGRIRNRMIRTRISRKMVVAFTRMLDSLGNLGAQKRIWVIVFS